jgi:SPP1 gp7 family putative phage head morphogenesis protein
MWALGDRHARDELNKARGEAYGVDMERLEDIAGDYLEGMAFRMLGHLTDDARDIVRDTLAAGIRYSWAFETIREKIVDALTRKGFLDAQANAEIAGRTLEEVQQALEGAGLTRHRLRTAIRTNGFEAINEARYSVFTDPGLGDFVEALEYTAILDSRTTEICRHLDGRIYPKDDPAWDGFRPPNHFNCRSLLVPVTQIDTDATGKDAEEGSRWSRAPTIQPQEGFGGS